ncbi:MAG: carboxymuconolactone decarboxylase family protein [Gammaproteobacteria bacterium]|nr:carboxymuconolactone decarboxylase family protein [Gammaproteobacteria bacterium]
MTARLKLEPARYSETVDSMLRLGAVVRRSSLERELLELVKVRASQINGCGFCLDMHTKDARAQGETEQRLYLLAAWREANVYSDRERAALAWTEAVTRLEHQEVPDTAYEQARSQFSEEELVALTLAVVEINGWNRFSIAFRNPAGDYQPGSLARIAATQS